MTKKQVFLWQTTFSVDIVSLYASFGLPVVIDLEHTSISDQQAYESIFIYNSSGTDCYIRCPEWNNSPERMNRILDLGCLGFFLPQVRSATHLKSFWHSINYPQRGACVSRMNNYSLDFQSYKNQFSPIVVPMVENSDILDSLDDLFSLPYVNSCLLGPYDLSQSLNVSVDGIYDFFDINHFMHLAHCNDVSVLIHSVNPSNIKLDYEEFDGIVLSTDIQLISYAISQATASLC